jgi:hypothetical protein
LCNVDDDACTTITTTFATPSVVGLILMTELRDGKAMQFISIYLNTVRRTDFIATQDFNYHHASGLSRASAGSITSQQSVK